MLVSQKIAIAAHLHVLLRRKTGRVTDTEWMAVNLEYAMEIVKFARAKATEDGHPDLAEWADKLERAVLEPTPEKRVPLAQTAAQLLRERAQHLAAPATPPAAAREAHTSSTFAASSTFGDTAFADSQLDPTKEKKKEANAPRYVGGIR